MLRANVMSPRIFWYDVRRAFGTLCRVIAWLALLGAAGWGVWKGVERGLLENNEFALREVRLNDNPALDQERLLRVASIDAEGTLFDCNPDAIEASLEALPELSGAAVHREFPGTLMVEVTAREPFVWIECGSQGIPGRDLRDGLLVDRERNLFRCPPGMVEQAMERPVIVIGPSGESLEAGGTITHDDYLRGLRLFRTALEEDPDAGEWVERIRQYKRWGSQLVTRDEIVATFGHQELERQMADFLAAAAHAREKGDRIATISLVGKRNLPVTFHEVTPPKAIPVEEPPEENPRQTDLQRLLER